MAIRESRFHVLEFTARHAGRRGHGVGIDTLGSKLAIDRGPRFDRRRRPERLGRPADDASQNLGEAPERKERIG